MREIIKDLVKFLIYGNKRIPVWLTNVLTKNNYNINQDAHNVLYKDIIHIIKKALNTPGILKKIPVEEGAFSNAQYLKVVHEEVVLKIEDPSRTDSIEEILQKAGSHIINFYLVFHKQSKMLEPVRKRYTLGAADIQVIDKMTQELQRFYFNTEHGTQG